MQLAIVIVVLITCMVYIVWTLTDTLRHAGDPCRGCTGCALKELKGRKLTNKERKSCTQSKKLGKNLEE